MAECGVTNTNLNLERNGKIILVVSYAATMLIPFYQQKEKNACNN